MSDDPDAIDTGDVPDLVTVVRSGHDGDPGPARRVLRAAKADPEVRASAVAALVRLARRHRVDVDEAIRAVTLATSDAVSAVRRRAALEAARIAAWVPELTADDAPVVELVAALGSMLADEDPTVAEVAAFACGEVVATGRAEQALDRSARDEVLGSLCHVATGHVEHLCREAAVAALGSIGDPSGLDAVVAGCRDRASVRRRAVLALAAFDGPEVTAELRRLSSDRDLQVRQAAEELLSIETGEPT